MNQIVLEILEYYKNNKREMPWRQTTDAYKIWLSEVVLQQTQVIQGTSYYYKFIENFPTVAHLANANEELVLKLWQGLGYYSRARNLHKAAKIIVSDYKGIFPKDYKLILKLPGIGEYTAAAICSFAFNQAYPTLDGNVFRLISRLYAVELPINEQKNRSFFMEILNNLILNTNPRLFNNAFMELGATVCKPQNPNCNICPVSIQCMALKEGKIKIIPIKTNKIKVRNRYLNFLHITYGNKFYITKRIQKDIWQNLYTLPLIESTQGIDIKSLILMLPEVIKYKKNTIDLKSEIKHLLTHQVIFAKFWEIKLEQLPDFESNNLIEVDINSYKNFAIPKLIDKYLLLL